MAGNQYSGRYALIGYQRKTLVEECRRMDFDTAIASGYNIIEKRVLRHRRAVLKFIECPLCRQACRQLYSKVIEFDYFFRPRKYSDYGCFRCHNLTYGQRTYHKTRHEKQVGVSTIKGRYRLRKQKRPYRKKSEYWQRFNGNGSLK